MKKILTIFMCMAMFMCFMPGMAFAGTPTVVAQIGEQGYATLQDAVNAAVDGETVTLQSNVTVSAMVTLNKSLIIDLNGKTLSSDTGNSIVQVIDEKTLTIDGTDNGSEVYGRINLGIATNNNGNAILNGGTYRCTEGQTVLHINGTCLNSNVTISGATITSPSDNGIQLNGKGTFLIENSTITGATAVYIKAGILTIKNSTLTGTKTPVDYSYNGNGANATGDGMVVDACNYPGGNPIVKIESGSFTGTKQSIGYYQHAGGGETLGTATIDITGGTFSSDPSSYVPESHMVTGTTTSKVVIKPAKIGSEYYKTLQAAVDAVADDETIELLADTVGDGVIVPSGKKFTLDFKGFKYTVNANYAGSIGTQTQCFQLLEGSILTFKNGTIEAGGEGLGMVVQNYSNLTLDRMTIDGSNLSKTTSYYTLSNNCGTVTLKNGTVIIKKSTADGSLPIFAMDSCKFGDYSIPTVTVESGVEIIGDIEATGGNLNIQGGTITGTITRTSGKVNITGGTFSSDPSAYVPNTHMVTGTTTSEVAIKPAEIGDVCYATLAAAFAAAKVENEERTITLLRDCSGGGLQFADNEQDKGYNVTIDFAGYTYTCNDPAVGSIGTESQGFHLVKGNSLTLKGGILNVDPSVTGTQMLIQNYCDLTLNNMTIDGRNLCGSCPYTLSNNFGLAAINDTTIIAKANGVAFDLWYGLHETYDDGVEVNISGNSIIDGKIEYGAHRANEDWQEKTKLNITAGEFKNFSIVNSGNCEDMTKASIDITGGTFSSDPSAYVASGYEVKENASLYTVSRIYVPSSPAVALDPVVNDKTAETTTAKIEPTTVDGKTTATIDTKTANTIVDKAIENKSSEVIINASSSTPVTPSTTPVESKVEIPTAVVKDIVEKTDASIVVKTDAGTIELDQTAAQAVADKAGEGEKVNLVVETKAEKEDQVVIELKIETASGNVTDFKGGNVKVTVNIPKALEGKKVVCVYVDENGNYTKMEGKLNADETYTFVTGHFSTYVVMAEEEATSAIEAQKNSKIAAGVQATTLKARSSAAKGKITVKWTKSKGFKVDYYQVFKATKKNGTFKYLAKTTKLQLVNKKGLKAGKTYYFKVRGVRVVDGAKIYTKWSKLAIRKAK